MSQTLRHQRSGNQNRQRARQRARAKAETGQIEIKFVANVADYDPLVAAGDLTEDDVGSPTRLSSALAELQADMARALAALHMEEREPRALSLYAMSLPGSRTPLGEARRGDLEIAKPEIRRQILELVWWDRWLDLLEPKLTTVKSVQTGLDLQQLRALRHLAKPR